jgi:phosphomannomutase/phosphoglucomutase
MSIFKDCDIRGIYDKELFPEDAYRVGRALARITRGGSFCVGGDVRLSTPVLKARLIRGLLEGGCAVRDLDTIATPLMYYALTYLPVKHGAMVTASHNPAQYNGIKFMLEGNPVTREQMAQLKELAQEEAAPAAQGYLVPEDILPPYLRSLQARFGSDPKGLIIVVDAGNGAMSHIAPKAFRHCGYRVTELFCEPDGTFPNRSPNPAEYSNLGALQQAVREEGAGFGVAFDGDGDRVVFCDEKGQVIKNERALALFVRQLLKDAPAPVVYDQKSSSVVQREILKMGGTPVPERSGHTFIKRRFLDLGAPLAGEVSGHFFFGELGYDDGLYAALFMGEILEALGQPLSEALRDIVCPPITPDIRIFCPYGRQKELLWAVEQGFPEGTIDKMDGVRVQLEKGWLLVRSSVTAEQITIRAEGESEEALYAILEKLRGVHPLLASLPG